MAIAARITAAPASVADTPAQPDSTGITVAATLDSTAAPQASMVLWVAASMVVAAASVVAVSTVVAAASVVVDSTVAAVEASTAVVVDTGN